MRPSPAPKTARPIIADENWLSRAPQKCPSCGGPLWQFARTFSAPKPGEKYPKRNPRMPLAEYIATVFPNRVYLSLSDEIHESKSTQHRPGCGADDFRPNCRKGGRADRYALRRGGVVVVRAGICLQSARAPELPLGHQGPGRLGARMGALERIVEYRPEYDKGGHYTGKRRIEQKPKEAPGCSPLLVREIIDHTVFVGLADIGRDMPDFEEIPVPIPMDADMELHYQRAKDKLGTYLFQCRMEGDASFLGVTCRRCWPGRPRLPG